MTVPRGVRRCTRLQKDLRQNETWWLIAMAYWIPQQYQRFCFDVDFEGSTYADLSYGQAVDATQLPAKVVVSGLSRKTLPDYFSVQADIWAVSERLRNELIQLAEQDFQFYPVVVVRAKSKIVVPGRYFFMNVITHRDSIVWGESNIAVKPRNEGAPIVLLNFAETTRITMDRARIGNAHAWHEFMQNSAARNEIFFSEELKLHLDSKKLGPEFFIKAHEI
jgi:hypothetical protein